MKSINHHPPSLSTHKHHWFPTNAPALSVVLPRHKFYLQPNHVRTKPLAMAMAINSSQLVILAVNSPATTGDLSVLIPTSAAFLFLYWLANFAVPEILIKELESQDADQNPNEEESIPLSKRINAKPKKKGFQSTK